MPATVLFLECKSYVIVGIYASISGFLLMCGDIWLMCGDVRFSGRPLTSEPKIVEHIRFLLHAPALTGVHINANRYWTKAVEPVCPDHKHDN